MACIYVRREQGYRLVWRQVTETCVSRSYMKQESMRSLLRIYETCIQEMKRNRKRKRSNRNITPILSSKLLDLTFFRLVGVGSGEWDSFVEGGLVGDIDNRWGFLVAIVFLGVLFLRW